MMTLHHSHPRDLVTQTEKSIVRGWRQTRYLPVAKAGAALLIALLLISNASAHTVVYSLSGNAWVFPLNPEGPPPTWTTFTGTFVFDGDSEPIPHEDPSWFWFRPVSRMALDFFGHRWKSPASASCDEIDMKVGYGGISWGCTLVNEDGEWGGVYMDLRHTSYTPGSFFDPYPMGPFTPENFRERDLWSDFMFSTVNYEARGGLNLEDVRFIDEPGTTPLCIAVSGALVIVRRARYRGTRALRAI